MASALSEWMTAWRQRIDAALDGHLARQSGAPARLLEAMRYSLLAPGKRLRPLLVLLAAEAVVGAVEAALPAACAVEMIHAYSLVHDDLPAMDDDDLRRGRPTCHKQFGEPTAILVGDGLQALAFQILAEDVKPAELAAECCSELARGAGVQGMVGGQMDDLDWENRPGADLSMLESLQGRKTAALFRAAARLGGLIGLATASDLRRWQAPNGLPALSSFGEHLGHAFQVADDLLDVESSETQTGKRTGKDTARGKLTYPGLIGIEASRRELAKFTAAALTDLTPLGANAGKLRDFAILLTQRSA
jgi:geranylgeranyl diphosphate synthase type II